MMGGRRNIEHIWMIWVEKSWASECEGQRWYSTLGQDVDMVEDWWKHLGVHTNNRLKTDTVAVYKNSNNIKITMFLKVFSIWLNPFCLLPNTFFFKKGRASALSLIV